MSLHQPGAITGLLAMLLSSLNCVLIKNPFIFQPVTNLYIQMTVGISAILVWQHKSMCGGKYIFKFASISYVVAVGTVTTLLP